MKLRDYLNLVEEGAEITCWDVDVDSEFYFYKKEDGEKPDPEFPNVDLCNERLLDVLDVVKIHDGGVEVNLYQVLDNPKIIQYAKENLYGAHQYEDDSDVVMLLFDDNVKNFSAGYEEFSGEMVKCLDLAYGNTTMLEKKPAKDAFLSDEELCFIDDEEKMVDFAELTKEEFLASYSYLTEKEYDATARLMAARKDNVFVINEQGEALLARMYEIYESKLEALGEFEGTCICEDAIETVEDAAAWCLLTYDVHALDVVDGEFIQQDKVTELFGFDVYDVKAELEKCLVPLKDIDSVINNAVAKAGDAKDSVKEREKEL